MLLAPTITAEAKTRVCILFCVDEVAETTDTLCTMQERMIRSSSDSAAVKALPLDLQRRIVANETRYRCKCTGWNNPVCDAPASQAR
jgi:hypothetical protein